MNDVIKEALSFLWACSSGLLRTACAVPTCKWMSQSLKITWSDYVGIMYIFNKKIKFLFFVKKIISYRCHVSEMYQTDEAKTNMSDIS